jgi:uncharacterized membrane protein
MVNQHACFVCRWMDHTFVWRPSYKRIFNTECLANITQAVQRCESGSDVEVCVIAEQTLPFSYLRRNLAVRERAIMLFGKHRVWDTEGNTGVLIYVNMVERSVELIADRGIARALPQAQWDIWATQLNGAFARNEYQAGLLQVINAMVLVFSKTLPRSRAQCLNTVADTPIVL